MANLPECSALLLDQQGSRLYVTINRPEARNALSNEVVDELSAVIDAIADDRGIRTVILRGAGGTFCAGGDIKSFQESFQSTAPTDGSRDPIAINNNRFGEFMIKLNSMPQTLVGVIEGAAFGGGLGLVCATDIAICAAGTKFALSETGLGIPPAQIAPFVVQRVGITNARLLALSGARFNGPRALELGLVHFIADDADGLEATLKRVLNDIGKCAPGANAETKRILLDSQRKPLDEVLADAADTFARQLRGPEGQAGVMAFLQKQPAAWVETIE
ncbi:MAG: enoyl-CoA hydratase/isomerase family protein [Candidatus Hydrogenedens sp.]|nr:enoyl-CoA hydratase/isomerase family protein [Candidatus Hydrogenedens sp.]